MLSSSHRKITEKAIGFLKNNELSEHKSQIINGSYKQDYPRLKILGFKINISSINHFYHPEKERATWLSTKNAKQLGVQKFNKALKYYSEGKKEKAYFNLGASLHYIQDVACPSHTNFTWHYFGDDDFEKGINPFLEKEKINKIELPKKRIEFYFEDLSEISSKFHSGKKDITEFIKWLIRKSNPLSKQEIDKQHKVLIPLALSYTIRILENFIQKTQKAPVV